MQGTVLALFGAALAAGLAELLLPTEDGGTAKIFRFLVSLVVLLLILTPFFGFLRESEELLADGITFEEEEHADFEQIFSETMDTQGRAEFEKGLYAYLEKEHGIAAKDATLLARFDTQGELIGVSVYLSGGGVCKDPEALQRALSQKLGCTVEVR